MINNNKNIFWEALLVTIFVFGIGVLDGVWFESLRTVQVSSMYENAELDMLDVKIQSDILNLNILDCEEASKSNINFADKIYSEAITLTQYEDSNQFTDSLIIQHKKYDLLRAQLWINSLKIKEQCNSNYHNLVYFYKYNNPTLEEKAKQLTFSKILEIIKAKYGDKVLLIPIAGDNNITSVDLLMKKYKIKELPAILIDEKTVVTDTKSVEEMENLIVL
jgi:hypothetical protein